MFLKLACDAPGIHPQPVATPRPTLFWKNAFERRLIPVYAFCATDHSVVTRVAHRRTEGANLRNRCLRQLSASNRRQSTSTACRQHVQVG